MTEGKVNHEAWLKAAMVRATRCTMCNDEALPVLKGLLKVIANTKMFKVSTMQIGDRLEQCSPGFKTRVGPDTIRKHLRDHETEYQEAKRRG